MKQKDAEVLVRKQLVKMGFTVLKSRHQFANGPDLWCIKYDRAVSVEIKVARVKKSRALEVLPVQETRKQDHLIAIVLPNKYVLIEAMEDHLKLCSPKGTRYLSLLF